jgi:TRAP-type C4-dicarboxylate transport system substrate-binding protein
MHIQVKLAKYQEVVLYLALTSHILDDAFLCVNKFNALRIHD